MYKRIAGVYLIKCKTNGDRYIGSSKSILERFSNHRIMLRNNNHHNRHLQNVWNKYREESFSFELLEELHDETILLEREQYWIDTLKPELNKAVKADSGFLGLHHKLETKNKLSEIQKNRLKSPELKERLRSAAIEQNKRQPNSNKGKRMSEEQKGKLREATLRQFSSDEGRKNHSDAMKKWMTPEMRDRISKAKKGIKRSVEAVKASAISLQRVWDEYTDEKREERVSKIRKATILARAKKYHGFVDPNGVVYKDVYNLAEFCRTHGLSNQEMCNVNSGKKKSHKGWEKLID